MLLQGKSAVITGSTSGIGLGIARALAGQGADILLNGFGPAAEIGELQKCPPDIQRPCVIQQRGHVEASAITTMVGRAMQEFGRVDILVNNAGIQFTAPVHKFPTDRWDAIISINLSAAFHATKAVLPQMLDRNWGRIINIASTHGLVGSVEKSAYVAAKHGLVGFTKVVALETARTGITCNAICPGWVLTPLVQKQIDDRAKRENIPVDRANVELLSEKQPSHEFATVEQLGALAAFLCSASAAEIRGVTMPLDGGWVAQ